MYVGGAGGYSFYVRKGEQVIRQRKNNSNYGASASRTYAQMIRRVKWGNLVNVFKAMKSWQPKAYDSKKQGQTDYNIFMQLNINRATAALTREMCLSGCAVIEPCQVSRGSLPPIALALAGSGNQYVSDIVISNAISGSTTVGQLSADIIANNPQFQDGDNLAFCFFLNWKDSRVEWPFVATRYTEITLDTTSSTVVNSIPSLDNRLSKATGGTLQVSWSAGTASSPNNEVGMVLVHTRKSASMLAVSSQEIVMNDNSILGDFSGNTWYQTCIDTYGLTDDVPLEPSFPKASISSVTANGSAVSSGESLEGSQELRVFGSNLDGDNFSLTFNGVEYTPLFSGDGYVGFIIGDNGTVQIHCNGRLYMTLRISGVVVPDGLPTRMFCGQKATIDFNTLGANSKYFNDANCANYPYKVSGNLQYFRYEIRVNSTATSDDFDFTNADLLAHDTDGSPTDVRMILQPVDVDSPIVVRYKDFIVAVLNYVN